MTNPEQFPIVKTRSSLAGRILILLSVAVGGVGLFWIVIFYASQGSLPLSSLGTWNILFGAMLWLASLPILIVGIVLVVAVRKNPQR